MKRKNKIVPVGLIVVGAVAALAAGTMLSLRNQTASAGEAALPQGRLPAPEAILPEPPSAVVDTTIAPAGGTDVVLYQVATDDNGSHLKKVNVHLKSDGTSGTAATAQNALNAMATEADSPLPTGTRAQSYALGDDGVATVDFNQAFVDNFKGGDEAEALTINAVLATLGQFGAHSVQITVAGKKIDSLGGTQSLTNPLPVPQVSEEQTALGGKS